MLLFPEWLGAATFHFFMAIRKILVFSSKFYMALNILPSLSGKPASSHLPSSVPPGSSSLWEPTDSSSIAVNLRKTPRSGGIKVTWELASSLLLSVYMSLVNGQWLVSRQMQHQHHPLPLFCLYNSLHLPPSPQQQPTLQMSSRSSLGHLLIVWLRVALLGSEHLCRVMNVGKSPGP